MSHELLENDNMFSVLETPWHGLGNVLDHPPTIEEGIEQAGLGWTVTPMQCFAKVPITEGQTRGVEIPYQAIRRDDTGEILGVVGSSYTPLQNIEAFGVFAPLVEDGSLLLETAGSLKNGRRVWILAKINTEGKEVKKDDLILPYVMLSNSHDGTMAVRFGFTPIRVVCNNTLSYAESGEVSRLIRVVHKGNLYGNIEALKDMLNLTKATFEASIEQYKLLANTEINQSDLEKYIKIVLKPELEEIDEKTINSPTQNKIIELFENGRGSELAGKTWWGAYNAINEYLLYIKGRNQDNRLNSVWFGDGSNINNRALNVALKLINRLTGRN